MGTVSVIAIIDGGDTGVPASMARHSRKESASDA
jgi:hypothetical protein